MNALWGVGASDLLFAGSGGEVVRYDGGTFTLLNPADRSQRAGTWAAGPSDVWFTSGQTSAWHFDGGSMARVTLPGTNPFGRATAISGSGSSDVWIGGEQGSIFHFDGTSWSSATS